MPDNGIFSVRRISVEKFTVRCRMPFEFSLEVATRPIVRFLSLAMPVSVIAAVNWLLQRGRKFFFSDDRMTEVINYEFSCPDTRQWYKLKYTQVHYCPLTSKRE